jgi:hypothetical protein
MAGVASPIDAQRDGGIDRRSAARWLHAGERRQQEEHHARDRERERIGSAQLVQARGEQAGDP